MNQIGSILVSTDGDIFRPPTFFNFFVPEVTDVFRKHFINVNRNILLGILSNDDRLPQEIWYNVALFFHDTTLVWYNAISKHHQAKLSDSLVNP